MHGFETVLALLVGVTLLATMARRFRVPTPSVLVAGGIIAALVPGLPKSLPRQTGCTRSH
jgi:hypothetical protein